jgi:hypothetical protein
MRNCFLTIYLLFALLSGISVRRNLKHLFSYVLRQFYFGFDRFASQKTCTSVKTEGIYIALIDGAVALSACQTDSHIPFLYLQS